MIAISPSNLNMAEECYYKYYARYISKEIKAEDNAAFIKGRRIHDNMQKQITMGWDDSRWSAEDRSCEAEARKYVAFLTKLKENGYDIATELSVAVDKDGNRVDNKWAKNVYIRCEIDVLAVRDSTALIIDWKTGRTTKKDNHQLVLNSLCVHGRHKHLKQFKIGYAYLELKEFPIYTIDVTRKKDIEDTVEAIKRLEKCYETNTWPAQGVKWCYRCNVASCVKRKL